jgi:CRISPR/Cas system-associated protein endoribonuclease Cas2
MNYKEKNTNKKIYIIVSFTGTILSRIVRFWTRKKYSHTSISLDKKLNEMYSFGRVNPYNIFIGNFVHESPKWGTLKRFKKTKCSIISLDVTEKQYSDVKKIIEEFKNNGQKHYKFNIRGIAFAAFNIRIKQKNKYYCSEFVKYVLDNANIINNLPEVVKPMDFLNLEKYDVIYEGYLNEYPNIEWK